MGIVYRVIHDGARADRCRNVADLYAAFGADLAVAPAVFPLWESDRVTRAVRGCSLAHLFALRECLAPDTDVAVFEDDVCEHAEGRRLFSLERVPADAGIVLMGGETENVGPRDADGWREVFPKFWGTHAVLYRAALARTPFLLNAFSLLASNPVGNAPEGFTGLCYESVLCMALQGTGLKMVRPEVMPYTTTAGWSARESGPMPARSGFLDLRAKDSGRQAV